MRAVERELAHQVQRITGCVGCINAIRENQGAPLPGCRCWISAEEIAAALGAMPSEHVAEFAGFLLAGTVYHVRRRDDG